LVELLRVARGDGAVLIAIKRLEDRVILVGWADPTPARLRLTDGPCLVHGKRLV
jgi:hypothetical protein